MYRPGANEQVYVSAVADRVNVGKDEGLRFSGWTELGEGGKRERRKGGETRENRRICIAGTGIRVRGRRKKFRAHRVSARGGRVRARFRIFMRYITYSGKWHVTWFTGTDNGGIKRARERMAPRDSWVMHPSTPSPRSPCRATSTHARTHACARVTLSAF